MRKLMLLLMMALCASVAVGQAAKAGKPAASNDAAQLIDIENKWNDALLKGDAAYMDSITVPGYFETMPDATIRDKARLLDELKSGKTKFESFVAHDIKPHVYGDAAVVTGAFTEKGVENGKPFSDSGRYTDTFIKKDGKWLAVTTHVSLKPPAKAAAKPAAKTEK